MDFQNGEILYFNKPLRWTSFDLVNKVRTLISKRTQKETTPSFDLETEVDATYPTEHITRELVEQTLQKFIGEIQQIPPAYSAVKIDGKRAYEYARKGKDVEIKPKTLVIDEIEILECNLPQTVKIRVVCSKGTYIRALARDIGQELGSGAHLIQLERTRIGDVKLEDCITVEQFDFLLQHTEVSQINV
jgi:tRNA pseudouridine55 synthase